MPTNADRHKPDRFVRINPTTAEMAQSLAPTSALTRITDEALREWIAERQRRAAILTEAEKKAGSD